MDSLIIWVVLLVIAIVIVSKTVKIVPQQHAWVLERFGRYHATLSPGLNIVLPFVDRIAYRHVLRKFRSTCRARSASRATTRSFRSTACCISR